MADEAILEFEVKVTAKASDETKQLLKDLKEAKLIKESHEQAMQQEEPTVEEPEKNFPDFAAPEQPGTDEAKFQREEADSEEQGKVLASGNITDIKQDKFFKGVQDALEKDSPASKITDALGKLDEVGLANVAALAKNPIGATSGWISDALTMLGPEAAMLMPALVVAIAAPETMALLLKALSVKGGPANRDWRFHLAGQVNEGLTRQQIIEKQNGLDPVFLSQQIGFRPNNGNWTYSSLYTMDAYRIHRIGLADKAAGIVAD